MILYSEIEKSLLLEENSHILYFIQDIHNLDLAYQHNFVEFLVRNSPQYPSQEQKVITTIVSTKSSALSTVDERLVSILMKESITINTFR